MLKNLHVCCETEGTFFSLTCWQAISLSVYLLVQLFGFPEESKIGHHGSRQPSEHTISFFQLFGVFVPFSFTRKCAPMPSFVALSSLPKDTDRWEHLLCSVQDGCVPLVDLFFGIIWGMFMWSKHLVSMQIEWGCENAGQWFEQVFGLQQGVCQGAS